VADGVKTYTPSNPVTFTDWDMETYGDRWTMIVEEQDPAITITKVHQNTVTYGTNFAATAQFTKKIGATFGGSATFVNGTTTTYSSTEGNDELGTAVVTWSSPYLLIISRAMCGLSLM
jgi:hypothetical protein